MLSESFDIIFAIFPGTLVTVQVLSYIPEKTHGTDCCPGTHTQISYRWLRLCLRAGDPQKLRACSSMKAVIERKAEVDVDERTSGK